MVASLGAFSDLFLNTESRFYFSFFLFSVYQAFVSPSTCRQAWKRGWAWRCWPALKGTQIRPFLGTFTVCLYIYVLHFQTPRSSPSSSQDYLNISVPKFSHFVFKNLLKLLYHLNHDMTLKDGLQVAKAKADERVQRVCLRWARQASRFPPAAWSSPAQLLRDHLSENKPSDSRHLAWKGKFFVRRPESRGILSATVTSPPTSNLRVH